MESTPITESAIYNTMQRITLSEMKAVKLMNRTDTKFVAPRCALAEILSRAKEMGYMVQYTNGVLSSYSTIYFDTHDLEMYTMHHNRKLRRQKIRCRTYVESKLSFLEIKNKNNKGRTKKIRITVDESDSIALRQNDEAIDFVNSNTKYRFNELVPALTTEFSRITLVNPEKTERITIDLNVSFYNFFNKQCGNLKPIIIIELKQDGRYVSTMRQILRDLRIMPLKMSKYCMGTVITTTNPNVKTNRFKIKLKKIKKLSSQNYDTI